ncbi:hypothetical protein PoB_001478300 [Plakobranchus ocellatus]|uniref:Uncharacterized protein n=1 Tax=Plakobranchus ocellatus TaxID=259542 RepID=A0AAV3Z0H3_9GAST|nr:hypothetical protein PoB_001478300 [Plakobranchus ocellatus]
MENQGVPARGLVREGTAEQDGNTQEAPARGLVRVAMGDSSTQEAPARDLGRVSMEGSTRGAHAEISWGR